MITSRRLVFLSLLVTLGACKDTAAPPPPLEIRTIGRLERSGELTLVLLEGTDTVPAAQVTWAIQPAASFQQISTAKVKLLATGPLMISAQYAGRSATASVTVAAPPLLVMDLIRNDNRDIYVVALDGGDMRRLTTSTADDRAPTVSGDRVVFVSYRNGNGELYSILLSGAAGSETRLTTTNVEEGNPSLSPNGQRLTYERPLAVGQPSKIWIAPLSDMASAQVAALNFGSNAALDASPVWTSNDALVFLSTAFFDADLFTINAPPATPAELVRAPGPQVDPAASADGTRVSYAANIGSDLELHVVNLQTRLSQPLLRRPGTDSRAVWLADGRVAFIAFDPAPMHVYWFDPTETAPILHEVPVGAGLVSQTKLAAVR